MTEVEKASAYAALFQAFAEGQTIQVADAGHWYDTNITQIDTVYQSPSRYRIKPELVTSVGYRRYVYKDNASTDYLVAVVLESDFEADWEHPDPEDWKFIKWIDEEWQYVEVEEKDGGCCCREDV